MSLHPYSGLDNISPCKLGDRQILSSLEFLQWHNFLGGRDILYFGIGEVIGHKMTRAGDRDLVNNGSQRVELRQRNSENNSEGCGIKKILVLCVC